MAPPKAPRAQRFLLKSGERVHDYTSLLSLLARQGCPQRLVGLRAMTYVAGLKRPARHPAPASALTVASGGDSAPFERTEKGGTVELRSADAADRARFRQLAGHLKSPALAHDKLGLPVGGDDQLLALRQAINQAGIVARLAHRNGHHNGVTDYRLTRQLCEGKWQERHELAVSINQHEAELLSAGNSIQAGEYREFEAALARLPRIGSPPERMAAVLPWAEWQNPVGIPRLPIRCQLRLAVS